MSASGLCVLLPSLHASRFTSPGKKWCHEDASRMMFDALLKENDLEMEKDDADFVKALIMGKPDMCR